MTETFPPLMNWPCKGREHQTLNSPATTFSLTWNGALPTVRCMMPSALSLVIRTAPLLLGLCFAPGLPAQTPDEILLKDYHPKSIFKIPETRVEKARYPVIDMHSHDYGRTDADVDRWVATMDAVGLEKTVILSGAT